MTLQEVPVIRQRLVIEGITAQPTILSQLDRFLRFLTRLSSLIGMHLVGPPTATIIPLPGAHGEGAYAQANWTESGCQLYTWPKYGLVTLEIYTCKPFTEQAIIETFAHEFGLVEYQVGRPQWEPPVLVV